LLDYNTLATDYARHRRVHAGVVEELLTVGAVTAAARVLEVGCGTGNYIVALESLTGCAGWGIDPSSQMLAQARPRSERIGWQLGRAERLDFAPASFDMIFSVDVIHHIADRPAFFAEAVRVAAPGGKVCTITDSEWIIRQRQPMSVYFPETVAIELERYPRIESLRAEMEQAGLRCISEHVVELSYALADIQSYRDKAFSALHLIPEEAFRRGVAGMECDLRAGPIPCVSRYLLLWGEKPSTNHKERKDHKCEPCTSG
jgi:SAM-dependent methyltransferase